MVYSKYSWVIWGDRTTPGKVCILYSHLSLQAVFPALKVTQNCYVNIKISLSWNKFFFFFFFYYELDLSPTDIQCLEDYPSNQTKYYRKYENKGTTKIPISQLYGKLAKLLKYRLNLAIFMKPNFSSFSWMWKNWEVQPG